MDESIGNFSSSVPLQKAMFVVERMREPVQLFAQSIGSVIVMMEVDLDIAEAAVTQSGNRLDQLRFIFVLRVEKRVLRQLAAAIRELLGEQWIFPRPTLHSFLLNVPRNMVPLGLKMVRHANEGVAGFWSAREPGGRQMEQ